MVLLDELRVTMSDYRKDLKELYEVLGIEKAQARYDELQKQVADPDFYSDLENSQKVLQEVKSLENRINKYKKMEETLDDILTLIELTMEEGEEESNAELNEEADSFVKELESLKLASLLTGEYDSSNAILTFHAGAGGTEACIVWYVCLRLTPPDAVTPLLRRWKLCRKSTTPWKWTSVRKISRWMSSVPAAPADSTSTRPAPPFV